MVAAHADVAVERVLRLPRVLAEQRLGVTQLDLVVVELVGTRQLPRETSLAGALGAGTAPAEQLEVVCRLMAVSPLDRQQPPRPIGQDVERPLAVSRIAVLMTQRAWTATT